MSRLLQTAEIDCDTMAETRVFAVGTNTIASVQARSIGETAWSAGILTLQWRLSGAHTWQNFVPTLTITNGTPYLRAVDIFGVPEIGVVVTTTGAGVRLEVAVWAEGSE